MRHNVLHNSSVVYTEIIADLFMTDFKHVTIL